MLPGAAAILSAETSRDPKRQIQLGGIAMESRRNVAEQAGHIEQVVIEGKIV
jgi:hypothetical protein